MMAVGIALYKRTDNLTESEPRMTSTMKGFKAGQLFEVPLHNNDRQYATVLTGLIKVQPDRLGKPLVEWANGGGRYIPDLPAVTYPDHAQWAAVNGCPLSQSVHRTYFIGSVGEYFLETQSVTSEAACDNFNVKMLCSSGAKTASPADSDPNGFSVDVKTGAISGTPERVRDGYIMLLRAVDAADMRATVASWSFDVKEPPAFSLNPAAGWSEADLKLASKYHIDETHLLPRPRLNATELLQHPARGAFDQVVYLLSAVPVNENSICTTVKANLTQAISALTDVATGEGAININCEGNYTAKLVVRDGAGNEVTIRNWTFQILRRDTDALEHGPGGRGCANGNAADGEPMDRQFTCNCVGTKFTGDNCEIEDIRLAHTVDQDDTLAYTAAAILTVLVVLYIIVVLLLKYQRYQRSLMATDFKAQLRAMKERGEVDDQQVSKGGVPRELARRCLTLTNTLGAGAFGEVWKGLLRDRDGDGDSTNTSEYMVACKVVKEAAGNLDRAAAATAEEDLLKEALLMAQVETHAHLVSLVGVVTRGSPKILVLTFCEHGELQGALKKHAADGESFSTAAKCTFCKEVAAGMEHLSRHGFVHRDLATRNVLLGSGMVCKVADFGMSRRVQTEDNTGDYYRSSSGIIPVRWTAPESMTSQKFSSASDVWSFGITCMEIFQDGEQPYPGVKSNPEIITMVCTKAQVHPRPKGCSAQVYAEVATCWSFEPLQRPEFAALETFFEQTVANRSNGMKHISGERTVPRGTRVGTASLSIDGAAHDLGHQSEQAPNAYDLGHQRQQAAQPCVNLRKHSDTDAGAGQHFKLGHEGVAAGMGRHYNYDLIPFPDTNMVSEIATIAPFLVWQQTLSPFVCAQKHSRIHNKLLLKSISCVPLRFR